MTIRPKNPQTYTQLLQAFEVERNANTPKALQGYIERLNQPPINAFLNVSIKNHQGIATRVGHLSLSLLTPIQLDILAWAHEQPKGLETMAKLRDALCLDLVQVADTRCPKPSD